MLVLKDFFGYRTTFCNERNGTKGAKGRGVWSEGCGVRSEGRGPLWGGRAEDVTALAEDVATRSDCSGV